MDGVLCSEEKTFERALAKPLPGAREAMNALREAGHQVVIYSARSWSELKMTQAWLQENSIPYDGIHLGKPVADRIIDDRAINFIDWEAALETLRSTGRGSKAAVDDEALLYLLRRETKSFLEEIASRPELDEPVLEVGPMAAESAANSPVFKRMPDTFVDSRVLFRGHGKRYLSMDLDTAARPDIVCDFTQADRQVEKNSIGTVILMSCLEHMPNIWRVPDVLQSILKPSGRAFMLTPWNLRFHGPRPDCWRISDDGYHALFGQGFQIERIEVIKCPGRPLSPAGVKCIVRKAPDSSKV
jgi:hypothetical protein